MAEKTPLILKHSLHCDQIRLPCHFLYCYYII